MSCDLKADKDGAGHTVQVDAVPKEGAACECPFQWKRKGGQREASARRDGRGEVLKLTLITSHYPSQRLPLPIADVPLTLGQCIGRKHS